MPNTYYTRAMVSYKRLKVNVLDDKMGIVETSQMPLTKYPTDEPKRANEALLPCGSIKARKPKQRSSLTFTLHPHRTHIKQNRERGGIDGASLFVCVLT